ncbi:MAG: FkbM family methyltransferase [Salinarimonadaceae bacterium]|nr:MAG: FkbM family methyltransferase [Salinarimonadaceae bacterium]
MSVPQKTFSIPRSHARSHSWARRQWGALRKRWLRLRYGDAEFVVEYFGARFACRLADGVGKGVALNTYDHRQLSLMLEEARREKPDLFLDIGANFGLYACILARNGAVAHAIAFEPDRRNEAQLRANIARNGLDEIVAVEPLALGPQTGEARLAEGPASNRGASRLVDGEDDEASYTVPVRRLDDLVALTGARILAKIDVEGREAGVLAGMERLLRENRCFLQIEAFSDSHVAILEACGYMRLGAIANDQFWSRRD